MANSKKTRFSKLSILKNILQNWLVLGSIGWIDAKRSMWLNGYGHQAVRHNQGLKQAKNAFFVLFACFRPYVGQPDDHISWVTLMPFTSIYPTGPRTNPAQFCKNILRIDSFEKHVVFESAILKYFFQKEIFFCSIPWKTVKCFWVLCKDGSKIWWLPWFPANEVLGQHLCTGLYVLLIKMFFYLWIYSTYYLHLKVCSPAKIE